MPKLNKARSYAASCYFLGSIYVFDGGVDGLNGYRPQITIEKLVMSELSQKNAQWQVILPDFSKLPAMIFVAAAPLNDTEILIFGAHQR